MSHRKAGRKRALTFLLVSALIAAFSGTPAHARHYQKKCEQQTLETNATATMCAFIDQHDFNGKVRGVGKVTVDRGTADIEIRSVELVLDGATVDKAGPRHDTETTGLQVSTRHHKTTQGVYLVRMHYSVGIEGGGHSGSTLESGEWDVRNSDENEPEAPL